jgi:RNA polymerase sigma factor (sigma-70 family)
MERYTYVLDQLRRDDFRRLRRFQAGGESAFSTWLVVVVRRLCVDFHRQRYGRTGNSGQPGVQVRGESRRLLEDLVSDAEDLASVPDFTRGTITKEYTACERHHALERAMETLAPTERLLLKLRFEDGLTLKEIAQVPGFRSLSQVHRRLESLLVKLRVELERAGIDPAYRD